MNAYGCTTDKSFTEAGGPHGVNTCSWWGSHIRLQLFKRGLKNRRLKWSALQGIAKLIDLK